VGVYPAASITGTFILTGTQHAGDATALAAQAGLTNALTVLGGLASVGASQSNLNNVNLAPGVYNIGAANLTGTLTLTNTLNVTNPTWVFIGSALTSSGTVQFAPGVNTTNAGVYWDISSSASLSGVMLGNVLASTSITTTGVTDNCGRLLASTGDVTFAGDNTISNTCSASTSGSTNGLSGGLTVTPGGGGGTVVVSGGGVPRTSVNVPEPSTLLLLSFGLVGLAARYRRKSALARPS
jgi:hypothetical protein